MNVLLFGATGMVGQGVLRECLLAADVEKVLVVGRSATGVQNPKLREVIQKDFFIMRTKLILPASMLVSFALVFLQWACRRQITSV